MKYESVNELSTFDFHDAYINKIDFLNGQMIWEVENINATTQNSQNNFEDDMCIKNALVIFEDIKIDEFLYGGYSKYDGKGNLLEKKEVETITNQEKCREVLKNMPMMPMMISDVSPPLYVSDDGQYKTKFNLLDCNLPISFSKAIIKWDDFNGKAWYAREDFVKRSELFHKSWTKLTEEYKIGDVLDLTITHPDTHSRVEMLQGLTGTLVYLSKYDGFKKGEVLSVKLTEINKEWFQITVDLNGQSRQISFAIPVS